MGICSLRSSACVKTCINIVHSFRYNCNVMSVTREDLKETHVWLLRLALPIQEPDNRVDRIEYLTDTIHLCIVGMAW